MKNGGQDEVTIDHERSIQVQRVEPHSSYSQLKLTSTRARRIQIESQNADLASDLLNMNRTISQGDVSPVNQNGLQNLESHGRSSEVGDAVMFDTQRMESTRTGFAALAKQATTPLRKEKKMEVRLQVIDQAPDLKPYGTHQPKRVGPVIKQKSIK